MIVAVDWLTVSSLATAAGTLVLAFATFASVRSANRAARTAERSLLAGLRPVLMPSRVDDVAVGDRQVTPTPRGRQSLKGGAGVIKGTGSASEQSRRFRPRA